MSILPILSDLTNKNLLKSQRPNVKNTFRFAIQLQDI